MVFSVRSSVMFLYTFTLSCYIDIVLDSPSVVFIGTILLYRTVHEGLEPLRLRHALRT